VERLDLRAPDVVSDLLRAVRVRSSVYCRSHMGAPWGFGVEAHGNPSFHVVVRGRCWLTVDGEAEALPLRTGDLVVLPAGPRHWMRDAPGSPTPLLDDILATEWSGNGRLRHGGDGARTELVCGGFALEGDAADPILRALPPVLHVRSTESRPAPWVAAGLELLREISASEAAGAEAVLARLADAMLTQALRLGLAELAAEHPERVSALRDPQIARAVQLVHREPEQRWTVERLASAVGYSRSAFASRFRELVGEAPMAYVARTRLVRAATLLERPDLTLAQVARHSGYANEFSFSRAFKRAFGVPPGLYRAEAASPPTVAATR
jgi:AraC-like DNA-binding protein/mannose-6-phosphate isomerase-like protein (cupin superfamily)